MAITTLGRSSGKGSHRPNLNDRVSLVGWYRYRIGMTNIDGACSSWADASNSLHPLVQATASLRPTIRSDGSLAFNGTTQYLRASFALDQPVTVYIAFSPLTHTNADVIFSGVDAAMQLNQGATAGAYAINAASALAADGTISAGAKAVVACVFSSTASVVQIASGAASVTTEGDAGANDPEGITLGASITPGSYSNIAVYEMAVYSVAHSAAQRLPIMRYLGRVAQVGGIN